MESDIKLRYKRILLKLSGEALAAGAKGSIFNCDVVDGICASIKQLSDIGVQVAIVVGAGNIWRGRQGSDMERTSADHMGMLATTINAIALQESLRRMGADARVMTAAAMLRAAEINADVVMMGKNIDGVYTADPRIDPSAKKLDHISYMEILSNDLKVIDSTAASFGNENKMPLLVFGMDDPDNLFKAVSGEKVGTIIN